MKYIKYILISILVPLLFSCELEEDVKSFYSPETAIQSQNDAIHAVNGCYSRLRSQAYGLWDMQIRDFLERDHDQSMTVMKNPTNAKYISTPQSPQSIRLEITYQQLYQSINACNTVFEYVPDVEMDPVLQERLLGEAHFIRALSYFHLVRLFGGVPLIDGYISPLDQVERAPVIDLYNFIIDDFKKSVAKLDNSEQTPDKGRATKEAAMGYLVKVYTTMGGVAQSGNYPFENNPFNDYRPVDIEASLDSACIWAEKLYNVLGDGAIDPDFMNLWTGNCADSPEHLFYFGALSVTDLGNTLASYHAPSADYHGWEGNLVKYAVRPQWWLDNYEHAKDIRDIKGLSHIYTSKELPHWRGETVIYLPNYVIDGMDYKELAMAQFPGEKYGTYPVGNKQGRGLLRTMKYLDKDAPVINLGSNDIPMLRYADVVLLWAEAEARRDDGNLNLAYEKVNLIRNRAGLGTIQDRIASNGLEVNKDTFLDELLAERGREFVLEMQRKYDLVRFGKYVEKMNEIPDNKAKAEYSRARDFHNIIYPIHVNILGANQSLEQNYGY